eukprot:3954355-Amphidinium_carterae.1
MDMKASRCKGTDAHCEAIGCAHNRSTASSQKTNKRLEQKMCTPHIEHMDKLPHTRLTQTALRI